MLGLQTSHNVTIKKAIKNRDVRILIKKLNISENKNLFKLISSSQLYGSEQY